MGELESFATIYGMSARSIREKADAAFKTLGMEDTRNVLVREIPLGWKQKLAFMAATLHSPDIVSWMSRQEVLTLPLGVSLGDDLPGFVGGYDGLCDHPLLG